MFRLKSNVCLSKIPKKYHKEIVVFEDAEKRKKVDINSCGHFNENRDHTEYYMTKDGEIVSFFFIICFTIYCFTK